MNDEIQKLTRNNLLDCLNLLPNLKECLLQERVESDITREILQKLFSDCPYLQVLDFCGCASQRFSTTLFTCLLTGPHLSLPHLKRVSFHECTSFPAAGFDTLLPRLVSLTHLDLTRTQIRDSALFLVPESAHLTHLSRSRCTSLSGARVVELLSTHPAVCKSIIYLNLMADPTCYRLLEVEDVEYLLPRLPPSLRSPESWGGEDHFRTDTSDSPDKAS